MHETPETERRGAAPMLQRAQRAADAGHRVRDIPLGVTKVYALIAEGKLTAKKMGRATIITNWPEYLASLPDMKKVA